jgi:hypothetical protein
MVLPYYGDPLSVDARKHTARKIDAQPGQKKTAPMTEVTEAVCLTRAIGR